LVTLVIIIADIFQITIAFIKIFQK